HDRAPHVALQAVEVADAALTAGEHLDERVLHEVLRPAPVTDEQRGVLEERRAPVADELGQHLVVAHHTSLTCSIVHLPRRSAVANRWGRAEVTGPAPSPWQRC